MASTKTREERVEAFLKACKDLGFAHPHNLMNFVNGQMSVNKKSIRLPLTLPQDQILTDPDLRHCFDIKTVKMMPVLVFIDMEGADESAT